MADLEALIAQTPPPGDKALEDLEQGVWNRVAIRRAQDRERRLRLAALCVAAGIGGIAGGVSAPASAPGPSELSLFSPRMAATPLDVRNLLG